MNDSLFGLDLFGNPMPEPAHGPKLSDTFLYPPFSVWNAREGWWQERKAAWLRLGIRSEVGRGANTLGLSSQCEDYRQARDGYKKLATPPGGGGGGAWIGDRVTSSSGNYSRTERDIRMEEERSGVSIFDPVVCELVYRWFAPAGGLVLDPFAGGSVRGIVAARLGLSYYGIELRPEQIESNEEQAEEICGELRPRWHYGDARNMAAYSGPKADLVFTCPPYGDLERYSDDPRDLSTMTWSQFQGSWGTAIERAADRLAEDRFAAFVVGNFRAKDGGYRDLVGETVRRAEAAGLRYYNEAVLVTAVGSLPIRIRKQFDAGRKLGKTHQNVLVFVKGDWRKAAEAVTAAV